MSDTPAAAVVTRVSTHSNGASARQTLIAIAIALLAAVLAFHETWLSMAEVWTRSSTFNHGWLVLPAVGYLIARQRAVLARTTFAPDLSGLAVLAATCVVWWIGSVTQVSVMSQLAAVAAVPALVLSLAGRRVLQAIAFPLAYLVFAVPIGEELVPTLMKYTADFAAGGLRLFGIPVYREGMLISIPAGDFEVAKACSGIRYLVASAALGSLYAYLMYQSTARRLAFIGLSLLVPLIANGLRALLIILLAHWSNMRLAADVDHLIYGWLFFGLVMAATFWLGSSWRESPAAAPPAAEQEQTVLPRHPSKAALVTTATVAIALMLGTSVAAQTFLAGTSASAAPPGVVRLPARVAGWSGPRALSPAVWQPLFQGSPAETLAAYDRGAQVVWTYVAGYSQQSQGRELINSENRLFDETQWHLVESRAQDVKAASLIGSINRIDLRQGNRRRTILYWYVVDDRPLRSGLAVKLASSVALLGGRVPRSAVVAVSIEGSTLADDSAEVLREFVASFLAASVRCLARADELACLPVAAGHERPAGRSGLVADAGVVGSGAG